MHQSILAWLRSLVDGYGSLMINDWVIRFVWDRFRMERLFKNRLYSQFYPSPIFLSKGGVYPSEEFSTLSSNIRLGAKLLSVHNTCF